jgi:hypothetical protein
MLLALFADTPQFPIALNQAIGKNFAFVAVASVEAQNALKDNSNVGRAGFWEINFAVDWYRMKFSETNKDKAARARAVVVPPPPAAVVYLIVAILYCILLFACIFFIAPAFAFCFAFSYAF